MGFKVFVADEAIAIHVHLGESFVKSGFRLKSFVFQLNE